VQLDTRSPQPAKLWSSDPTLELSHCALRHAFPLHFHLEAVVAVIVEGAEAIAVNGRREVAEAGSIVVLEPERAHSNQPIAADGVRYRGFYVGSALLPDRESDAPLSEHVIRNRRLAVDLAALHQGLEQDPHPSAIAEAKAGALKALSLAARAPVTRVLPDEMRQIAGTLRDRCSERLAWAELVRAVGRSPAHLADNSRSTSAFHPTSSRPSTGSRLPNG
jgi:AraC-like ligand binding domain